MKKLAFLTSAVMSLLAPVQVLAIEAIKVTPPDTGFRSLTDFITKTLQVAFAVGILVVLAMLVWGAFEWITSGGDKDAVAKARNRIISALIGLAVLAITFALARVAAQFLGFDIGNITIPGPDISPVPPGQL